MKNRLFVVAAALVSMAALPAGQRAPDFSRPASNGQTITLKQYAGKRSVVLAFCPKAFTGG